MILVVLVSGCAGFVGAWLISKYGRSLRLEDYPGPRSSHASPVPKGGGLGVLAAFVLVCILAQAPTGLWIPAVIVSLLGLAGDRAHIEPKVRLAVQFAAALVSVLSLHLAPLYILPAMVFMVGTANFFNFMDGINGIAGLTGVAAFCLLGAFAYARAPSNLEATISFGLAAACVGFLPFNLPRARVFMGDVGSILLGYVFAWAVLRLSASPTCFLCLCAFLFTFYADELTTMFVRLRDGENLLHPHRRHLYQLLVNELGVAHWKVSLGYALAQIAVGLCAWQFSRQGAGAILVMLVFASVLFWAYTSRLRYRLSGDCERYPIEH